MEKELNYDDELISIPYLNNYNVNHDKIDKQIDYESCCVYIECEYHIHPFILFIDIMHDFLNDITFITRFILNHSYFKVSTSKLVPMEKTKQFSGSICIINSSEKFTLSRTIHLKVGINLHENTNIYSMEISLNKAPSSLQHKRFVINDIMNHFDVIKMSFWNAVYCQFDIQLCSEILSLICNEYLSKYFWIKKYKQSLLHSLNIDRFIHENIPKTLKHFDFGIGGKNKLSEKNGKRKSGGLFISSLCRNYYKDRRIRDKQMIENINYISYDDMDQIKCCKTNGISVIVQVLDDTINQNTYPQLFKIFEYYKLYEPQLSTIMEFKNPSTLFDVANLYKAIDIHCKEKAKDIHVQARFLTDDNNENISMLWINWKDSSSNTIDIESYDDEEIKNDKKYHDFYEYVEYYKKCIMELCIKDIVKLIENDDTHFGEPFVALIQMALINAINYDIMHKCLKVLSHFMDHQYEIREKKEMAVTLTNTNYDCMWRLTDFIKKNVSKDVNYKRKNSRKHKYQYKENHKFISKRHWNKRNRSLYHRW